MEPGLLSLILEGLAKQGFSFVILAGVVFYFHNELQRIKTQFDLCNAEIKMLYKTHSDEISKIMLRNTEAFERNNELLQELKSGLHG